MQCLFCGKELALLKRLRGGGEFCSEAHRKEYQDQYEQLALARLLHAQPPSGAPAPLGWPSDELPSTPDAHLEGTYAEESSSAWVATIEAPEAISSEPSYQPAYQPAELANQRAGQASNESGESGPAPLAGFLSEPMVPAVTPFDQAGLLELDNEWEQVTTLPDLSAVTEFTGSAPPASSNSQGSLPPAPRVELSLSLRALEHHTRTNERALELREFTGPAPVMELQLRPETGTEPAGADDVMEIFMLPHPPQKAKPWLGVSRGFPEASPELGDLARLDFATTGFAYSDAPVTDSQMPAAVKAPVLAPELRQAPPQVLPEAPPQAALQSEPAPEAFVPAAEHMAPPEPALPAEPAPPELVTKVLPVTLHGLAAGRAKLSQTYPSAITAAADVQIPVSATLPLRPAIVFGPSPASKQAAEPAAPVQAKPAQPKPAPPKPVESKQVQPALAQPAPVQSSPARSQPVQATPAPPKPPVQATPAPPKPEERLRPSVVPAPKAVPVKRPAAAETPVQERAPERNTPKVPAPAASPRTEQRVEPRLEQRPQQRAEARVEPRTEQRTEQRAEQRLEQRNEQRNDRRPEFSAPKTREAAAASDAPIPYELKATEGAWSKLSTGVKIGVAAAVLVVVSGIGYVVTRGNGKTATQTPAPTETSSAVASGVAISGGWIDDWANASRSRRHISVLSGSAKLSDYRLEFQAQIETKAIGWIFRGLNPRNYYVTKLEVVTPGLNPTIALVHFAVVDGQDENRVEVPLPMKVRVDTTYKIRFDAIGNHFTTWMQGQKIDEWTDSRFGSGGVGFFSERDEKAAMQGAVNVVALVPKN